MEWQIVKEAIGAQHAYVNATILAKVGSMTVRTFARNRYATLSKGKTGVFSLAHCSDGIVKLFQLRLTGRFGPMQRVF